MNPGGKGKKNILLFSILVICLIIMPVDGNGDASTSGSVDTGDYPATDAERTEFVNSLRMKGLSDEEVAEKIIEQINSQRTEKKSAQWKIVDESTTYNQRVEIIAESLDRMDESDSIKKASQGLWVYLVADDEFKKRLLSEIDEYENKTISRELLKNDLREIWKKYEVAHTRDGNIIYIDFKQKDPDITMTKEEIGTLQLVNDIHLELFLLNPAINPKSNPDPGNKEVTCSTDSRSEKNVPPMDEYPDDVGNPASDPDPGLPVSPQSAYEQYNNQVLDFGGAQAVLEYLTRYFLFRQYVSPPVF